jgi:cation diffusion facilitator CzcD-associated flavoprotein CzcO
MTEGATRPRAVIIGAGIGGPAAAAALRGLATGYDWTPPHAG